MDRFVTGAVVEVVGLGRFCAAVEEGANGGIGRVCAVVDKDAVGGDVDA